VPASLAQPNSTAKSIRLLGDDPATLRSLRLSKIEAVTKQRLEICYTKLNLQ
jgi:hypothetical protein